jgi:hypothetical protein
LDGLGDTSGAKGAPRNWIKRKCKFQMILGSPGGPKWSQNPINKTLLICFSKANLEPAFSFFAGLWMFMTNAEMIAGKLAQKCVGGHRHVNLINGKAKRSEIYPEDLCKEIIRGLRDQMEIDGRLNQTGVGCVFAIEEGESEMVFYDDLTGKVLEWEWVLKARAEEIKEFRKHWVYKKVPVKGCYDKTGKTPIGIRWIDMNKGDRLHPDLRSRLVAKEFKRDNGTDLFAATPPLEAKKMLFSFATTEGIGYSVNRHNGMKLDFIDVRRAYFHAPCKRDVYIVSPEEDAEQGMCGKFEMSM